MNVRHTVALAVSCCLLCAAVNVTSRAQGPESAGGPSAGGGAELRPTNLQVLPKDTSEAATVLLMVRYGQELGVQCTFCHVENPQTQQVDFVSDENPRKQTARIMIGMVRDINFKYLAQVGDCRYAVPISCANCHQGQTFPPSYQPKPQ